MEDTKYRDDLYLDLLDRYKEIRKVNVSLLEEKRELLLQAQEYQRTEIELKETNNICTRLKWKIDELQQDLEKGKTEKVEVEDGKSTETTSLLDTLICNEMNEIQPSITQKSICTCKSTVRLREVIKVNHQWQDSYSRLLERCTKLESEQQNLQGELTREREDNSRLRELASRLSAGQEKVNRTDYRKSRSLQEIKCNSDDIEALKQQMIAYQEDFNCERNEKEKSIHENKEMKIKLKQADEIVERICQENEKYKHCFNRATQEREHLMNELRRLSTSSLPMSPIYNPRQSTKQNFSYPPDDSEDIIPRLGAPILRRVPSDIFRGGDVVRDSI